MKPYLAHHAPECALQSMTIHQAYLASVTSPTLGCTCGAITPAQMHQWNKGWDRYQDPIKETP